MLEIKQYSKRINSSNDHIIDVLEDYIYLYSKNELGQYGISQCEGLEFIQELFDQIDDSNKYKILETVIKEHNIIILNSILKRDLRISNYELNHLKSITKGLISSSEGKIREEFQKILELINNKNFSIKSENTEDTFIGLSNLFNNSHYANPGDLDSN